MRATFAATGNATPSTDTRACWPTRRATTSSGATATSSSSRERSTISSRRASTATRSPGCTSRCDTRPDSGARISVSRTALRLISAAALAACSVANAPAALLTEVSSAVCEMKPCSTSALLLACWRSATSSWACAAAAWSSAWRSRQRTSVSSRRAISWPARTASPSRTSTSRTSLATLALTSALSTAFRLPLSASVATSSVRVAVATSPAASSSAAALAGAAARVAAAELAAWRATSSRAMPAPTSSTASRISAQRLRVVTGAPRARSRRCRGGCAARRPGRHRRRRR